MFVTGTLFFLREMVELFNELAGNPDCRVVVFSGAGRMFTAGRSPITTTLTAETLVYSVSLSRY